MDHEISAKSLCRVIIHTASSVSDIPHHNHTCMSEVMNDIGNCACIATNDVLLAEPTRQDPLGTANKLSSHVPV